GKGLGLVTVGRGLSGLVGTGSARLGFDCECSLTQLMKTFDKIIEPLLLIRSRLALYEKHVCKEALRIADKFDQPAVYCMRFVHKPFQNDLQNPENRPGVGI